MAERGGGEVSPAKRLAEILGILARGDRRAEHVNDYNSPSEPACYWWQEIKPDEMRRIYRLASPPKKRGRRK
jgi:hypothetical protein